MVGKYNYKTQKENRALIPVCRIMKYEIILLFFRSEHYGKSVKLKNTAGVVKEAKVGFSWTTFFFGGWVALFRGQWGEVLKWWLLNPITIGIWGICQCWTANKKHVISLIEKGYDPASENDRNLLVQRNIVA